MQRNLEGDTLRKWAISRKASLFLRSAVRTEQSFH